MKYKKKYAVVAKDKKGEVIYTFNTEKDCDEFIKRLTPQEDGDSAS